MGIKGGHITSAKQLKKKVKGNGGGFLKRVPADSSLTVRFLTEPYTVGDTPGWVDYEEHYDESSQQSFPCSEDNCEGCADRLRKSKKFAANVLDVEEMKVIPLQMPRTLAESVQRRYEKYGTLLDRDYELIREGSTKNDTSYDSVPEPPKKRNLSRYDLIDLVALLNAQIPGNDDDDEDDEDEAPKRRSSKSKASTRRRARDEDEDDEDEVEEDEEEEDDEDEPPARSRKSASKSKRRAPVDDDEDEEEEEEEDEEEEGEEDESEEEDGDYWTRDDLDGKGIRELKAIAKEAGYTTADYNGLDVDGVIDLILGDAAEEDAEDEEEAEEEDDEEVIDEDVLNSWSPAQVKKFAKDQGIKFRANISKDDLIELILEQGEDEEPPF